MMGGFSAYPNHIVYIYNEMCLILSCHPFPRDLHGDADWLVGGNTLYGDL